LIYVSVYIFKSIKQACCACAYLHVCLSLPCVYMCELACACVCVCVCMYMYMYGTYSLHDFNMRRCRMCVHIIIMMP
jgi:hypothetical protein